MEFQYYGANCVGIAMKHATIIVDDNLSDLGLKPQVKAEHIALFTQIPPNIPQAKLVITDPGEYEVSQVSIFGIPARAHMDGPDQQTATMYKVQFDDLRVLIVGHIHPNLSDDQLERIGMVDIVIIPVGGNGYTLDGVGAMQVVKKIEPKIVIPTHFDDAAISYPVPQQPLSEAIKAFGVEAREPVARFKVKSVDFSETLQVVILDR